jgi:hypothetical protein
MEKEPPRNTAEKEFHAGDYVLDKQGQKRMVEAVYKDGLLKLEGSDDDIDARDVSPIAEDRGIKSEVGEAIRDARFTIKEEELVDFEKAFPQTEIIEKEQEHVMKERIPSVARMDSINKLESVWLTYSAVRERLEALLQIDPRFNEKPPMAITQYSSGGMVQGSRRKPVSNEKMIEQLEQMGFAFSKIGGKVVMLVDAVIPAESNTNGRIGGEWRASALAAEGEYHVKTFYSDELGERGFQPATFESTHAIAIPLDEILKIHAEPIGVEKLYFVRD